VWLGKRREQPHPVHDKSDQHGPRAAVLPGPRATLRASAEKVKVGPSPQPYSKGEGDAHPDGPRGARARRHLTSDGKARTSCGARDRDHRAARRLEDVAEADRIDGGEQHYRDDDRITPRITKSHVSAASRP